MANLTIQRFYGAPGCRSDGVNDLPQGQVYWQGISVGEGFSQSYAVNYFIGAQNLSTTPYPTFPNDAAAIAYSENTAINSILFDTNSQTQTGTYYTTATVQNFDVATNNEFNSLATVAFSGNYNDLTSKPVFTKTFTNPTRTLNTAFQISATKDAMVSYTVDISASLSLTGGQQGTVTLKYADNSAFTTNVVTVQSGTNGNTGTLTIGLGLTQLGTVYLTGMIPAGKYVQIVTTATTGTPTFTYRAAQEVLF